MDRALQWALNICKAEQCDTDVDEGGQIHLQPKTKIKRKAEREKVNKTNTETQDQVYSLLVK